MRDLMIHKLEDWNGNEIFILREDLLPLACGGNKVRIGLKLLEDVKSRGATHIVGYGNSRSNLCRVLSMICAREKLACTIVSPSDADGARLDTTNSRLVALSGAKIVTCPKSSSVSDIIASVLIDIADSGDKPYYVFGNEFGKGNELILRSAYEGVAAQLVSWQSAHQLHFDRIALAVGTGSTYAGLLEGLHSVSSPICVTGFTIARERDRCLAGIRAFTDLPAEISDMALAGGYGQTTMDELSFIDSIRLKHAILFDSTYAGKALWGLSRFIVANSIRGEKILFIHTGSLPLALDAVMGGVHA